MDGDDKVVQIGVTLPDDLFEALMLFLFEFKGLFTWKPSDMLGINKEIITHGLKIDPSIRPIAEKRCPIGDKKALAIRKEDIRLVDANFI